MNYKKFEKEQRVRDLYDEDEITEEEYEGQLDRINRANTAASYKRLAPLFIYRILEQESSEEKHLRQQDILRSLEVRYAVKMERKAVARIVAALSEIREFGVSLDEKGAWIEEYQ
jgi:hypothetical protein